MFPLSSIMIIILALVNRFYLSRENNRKRVFREAILAPYLEEGQITGGERAWLELGDKHPDFTYSL